MTLREISPVYSMLGPDSRQDGFQLTDPFRGALRLLRKKLRRCSVPKHLRGLKSDGRAVYRETRPDECLGNVPLLTKPTPVRGCEVHLRARVSSARRPFVPLDGLHRRVLANSVLRDNRTIESSDHVLSARIAAVGGIHEPFERLRVASAYSFAVEVGHSERMLGRCVPSFGEFAEPADRGAPVPYARLPIPGRPESGEFLFFFLSALDV